jgi:cytochrome c-type biogenesis protein CcmH
MRFRLTTTLLLAALAASLAARAEEARPTVESVSERVMCLCGCVATLNHCPHPETECSMRAEMTSLIKKEIAEGKTEPAILQDFVERYGVKVLAAPPGKGFNLAAWVLPGFGLVVGLVCVVVIVRRWRWPSTAPVIATPAPVDPKLLAAVDEEMRTSGLGSADSGDAVSSLESRIPKPETR